MARIKLTLPAAESATMEIPVRITDINYGSHLGNDSLVSILHEARMQWLHSGGHAELNAGGAALIMAGLHVEFCHESFYGDSLLVTLLPGDMSAAGFELYYRVETMRKEERILIAKARTDMVFFDYTSRKVVPMPDSMRQWLSPA